MLLGAVLALMVLGFIMLVSIGPYTQTGALDRYQDVRKQGLFAAVGFAGMFLATLVNYRLLLKMVWPLYFFGLATLLACFLPGIGVRLNGASRWIEVGVRLQPSEFAKIIGIIAVAAWCSRRSDLRRTFWHGFTMPLLIAGALIVTIAVEVDLGNAALLTLGAFAVIYAGGARLRYIGMVVLGAAGTLGAAVMLNPERLGRISAMFNLEAAKSGDGLQQWLSLVALSTGGGEGMGIGNSRQKMWSLPYANSDFIFPIIGEELGVGFTLGVVLCFVGITIAGFLIAVHAPDRFGKLLGFGLVALISAQSAIHIGVTTAVLPNKGMPLPFVSAGGSNLICLLVSIGILLNIYRQSQHSAAKLDPVLGRAKFTPAI